MRLFALAVCLAVIGTAPAADPELIGKADAKRVLDEAIKCVADVPTPADRDALLSDICGTLAQLGNAQAVITVSESFSTPARRESSISLVAMHLAQAGNTATAQTLAAVIQNESRRFTALRFVAEAYAERGDAAGALKIADGIVGQGGDYARNSALIAVVAALYKARQAEQAQTIMDRIDARYHRTGAVTIAGGLAAAGDYKAATERIAPLSSLLRLKGTYAIVRAMAQRGDKAEAAKRLTALFDEAMAETNDRNLIDARLAIPAVQAEIGDAATAVKNYERALGSMPANLQKTVKAQSALQTALLQVGDKDRAVRVVELAPGSNEKAEAWCLIARWHLDRGDTGAAKKALDNSVEAYRGDDKTKPLYGALATVKAGLGDLDEAFAAMTPSGPATALPNHVAPDLVFAHARHKSARAAYEWSKKRETPLERGRCLTKVAAALLANDDGQGISPENAVP